MSQHCSSLVVQMFEISIMFEIEMFEISIMFEIKMFEISFSVG